MKSEIKNIRVVYKFGAHGDPNAFGRWIYGLRPDGKTVACKNEEADEGGIRIWSHWISPECNLNEYETCETVFSAEEWEKLKLAPDTEQQRVCNQILRARSKA